MMGTNIRKKMPISLKPSRRAASIMSLGKERDACRNSMIINGVEMDGSTNAAQLLTSPQWDIILNRGIIMATNGSIIASSRTLISASFALSW